MNFTKHEDVIHIKKSYKISLMDLQILMLACNVLNAWDAIAPIRFVNLQFSFKDLQSYLLIGENREEMRRGIIIYSGPIFEDTVVFFRLLTSTVAWINLFANPFLHICCQEWAFSGFNEIHIINWNVSSCWVEKKDVCLLRKKITGLVEFNIQLTTITNP